MHIVSLNALFFKDLTPFLYFIHSIIGILKPAMKIMTGFI